MTTQSQSVAKIINGAARAVARQGLRKLTMSDIGEEAGVSRGTLYRYFKSKEEVLEAVGRHVEDSLASAFDEAIAARPGMEDRLRVVLDVLNRFRDDFPETIAMVEIEPGFVLGFFAREFNNFAKIIGVYLTPALAAAPPVKDGVMTEKQLTEVFLRISMSTYLVPSRGSKKLLPKVADMWDSLVSGGR